MACAPDVKAFAEQPLTVLPFWRNVMVPPFGTGDTVAVNTTVVPRGVGFFDAAIVVKVSTSPWCCAMRLARLGEPHPVTWSQPGPAGLPPADPLVTSWKTWLYTLGLFPNSYSSGVAKPTSGRLASEFAWFHTAVIPAQSGAERLVPPTWAAPPL